MAFAFLKITFISVIVSTTSKTFNGSSYRGGAPTSFVHQMVNNNRFYILLMLLLSNVLKISLDVISMAWAVLKPLYMLS